MTGRYSTSGNLEAQFQLGSNNKVLANLLELNDAQEMDAVELALLVQLYDLIPELIASDQVIACRDICDWHRRWLGNVYLWAGQYRTVNLGKGDFHFAAAVQIDRLMDVLDKQFLSIYTPCCHMSDEELITAIAIVHVELILVHPFREGNGRLSRLLANVMAMQAGKPELDFSSWDENKTDYFAAIQAGLDDYQPMKKWVRQALHDAERNAVE